MSEKTPKIYDEIRYREDNYDDIISFLDDREALRTQRPLKIGLIYFTTESLDKAKVIMVDKLRHTIFLSSRSFDAEFKKNLTDIAQRAVA